MSGTSNSTTAAEKLGEAVKEIVSEKLNEMGWSGSTSASPNALGFINILFLLLLIANLGFLIYRIPPDLLTGPHWDLLGKAITILGSAFLAVVAASYKDWIVRIVSQHPFRISQVVLSGLILLLWLPLLPIRPLVGPSGAAVIVDSDEKHARNSNDLVWVSIRPHSFKVWREEGGVANSRSFDLSLRDVVHAALGGDERRWSLCYKVKFNSDTTKGYKVRIKPIGMGRLDAEFRDPRFLATHYLEPGDDNTLIFNVPSDQESWGMTQLPRGSYEITPFKKDCKGQPKRLAVGPEEPSQKVVDVGALGCG